jgi:hypothetical protein
MKHCDFYACIGGEHHASSKLLKFSSLLYKKYIYKTIEKRNVTKIDKYDIIKKFRVFGIRKKYISRYINDIKYLEITIEKPFCKFYFSKDDIDRICNYTKLSFNSFSLCYVSKEYLWKNGSYNRYFLFNDDLGFKIKIRSAFIIYFDDNNKFKLIYGYY